MKALKEMALALARQKEVKLIEGFLKEILTPSEAKTIGLRWELSKRLLQGQSQRKISAELGVSLCKITRGSRELHKRNSFLKRLLEEYLAWEAQSQIEERS